MKKVLLISLLALTGCANMEASSLAGIVEYTRMACQRGDLDKCRLTSIFLLNGDAQTREEAVDEFDKSCTRLVTLKRAEPHACAEMKAELQRRPIGEPAVKHF